MNLSYIEFLAGAMFISLTGVMAPGPLSAVTMSKGSDSPHAGVLIAVGHGIIEFPLMIAILFGFGYFFNEPYVKLSIGLAGGLFLLFMAYSMFKSYRGDTSASADNSRSPVAAGMVLSAANPYFMIWWATVGAAMLMQSAGFGAAGIIVFMIAHWICDLAWSWFLSALSFRGGSFFGKKFQKGVFAVSGLALVIFGVKFLFDSVQSFL
jgi:threonine/homoserine/homoserine lactone efflux protein